MCLIVHRPVKNGKSGSHIPNDVIDYNKRINPDGFGIAWREDRVLRHAKFGPKDFEDFRSLLKRIDADGRLEYVAHFRRATHGPACYDLSHPFVYDDAKAGETLVFHNGIIDIDTEKTESDTSRFVKNILAKLETRWWAKSALRFLVEGAVGYSRLLIMTKDETVRLNEDDWRTEGGIWYSTYPGATSSSTYGMYGKSAYGSYQAFKDKDANHWTDDEDDYEEEAVVVKGKWLHEGHYVSPLNEVAEDHGDKTGNLVCDTCKTLGEYYILDGKVYPDIKHYASIPANT